eukprot:1154423-Pelagomonas_calceolata.AAC.3
MPHGVLGWESTPVAIGRFFDVEVSRMKKRLPSTCQVTRPEINYKVTGILRISWTYFLLEAMSML